MVDLIRGLIGIPPVGYEYIEYFVLAIIFLILVQGVFNIFNAFSRVFLGK